MDRPLLRALLFTFFAHALAMLSMALLLLPGLPGGFSNSLEARAHYIATHSILWTIGWIPWILTALSDLLLSIALVRTKWIPRWPAIVSLILVVLGLIPDQSGQFLYLTRGITLARHSVTTTELSAFLPFETQTFSRIAYLATAFYLAAAIFWTISFAAARLWNRALTYISVPLWSLFLFACSAPWLIKTTPPALVALTNAIAFILLQLWFAILIELLLRRSRPTESHGRNAPWLHPRQNLLGKAATAAANSHFLRACGELVPTLAFRSDITDTIYINYLLPADRLQHLVPNGLELDLLGPNRDHALFSILALRHGNFGPRILGPLRRLMPNPIQSNWRIYVRNPRTGTRGVYFFSNAIDSTLHALSARLLSENMPMHVFERAQIENNNGTIQINLDPGPSTAPDLLATFHHTDNRELPPHWSDIFPDYNSFLAYCVPQDRAMSCQPWNNCITCQEITLDIPLDICQPLAGQITSRAVEAIAANSPAVCFLVPKVSFLFSHERREAI